MRIEHVLEEIIFRSRWLMAPFYLGLIVSLVLLLIKFVQEVVHGVTHVLELDETATILTVLSLIDLSLAANLLLMVIFSGYENFVSKIDTRGHEDRPSWMGEVDFSGLKLKLIASIVAISGIHLLQVFMNISTMPKDDVMWMVIIHFVFVLSGLLLALMDRASEKTAPH